MPKESNSTRSYSSSGRKVTGKSARDSRRASSPAERERVPSRRLRDEQEEEEDSDSREPNCPPCFPLIRFAISDLNSAPKKITAFLALSAWAALVILVALNFVAAWFPLVQQWSETAPRELWLKLVIVSFFHLLIVPFVSFFMIFWSVYWACTSGNSLVYLGFFISYVTAVIYCLVMFVGIPILGGCGILSCLRLILTGVWVSLLAHLIISFGWILLTVYFVAITIINYNNFRADNGNLVALKDSIVGKFSGLKAKMAISGVKNMV